MREKTEELYKKYLEKKLDEIFNSQSGIVQSNLLKSEYEKNIYKIFESVGIGFHREICDINGDRFAYWDWIEIRDNGIYCENTKSRFKNRSLDWRYYDPYLVSSEVVASAFYPVKIVRNFAIVYANCMDVILKDYL